MKKTVLSFLVIFASSAVFAAPTVSYQVATNIACKAVTNNVAPWALRGQPKPAGGDGSVSSVNGRTGDVVIVASDIAENFTTISNRALNALVLDDFPRDRTSVEYVSTNEDGTVVKNEIHVAWGANGPRRDLITTKTNGDITEEHIRRVRADWQEADDLGIDEIVTVMRNDMGVITVGNMHLEVNGAGITYDETLNNAGEVTRTVTGINLRNGEVGTAAFVEDFAKGNQSFVRGVTSVVTKAYVEGLGIGGGGVDTNAVKDITRPMIADAAVAGTNYTDAAVESATDDIKREILTETTNGFVRLENWSDSDYKVLTEDVFNIEKLAVKGNNAELLVGGNMNPQAVRIQKNGLIEFVGANFSLTSVEPEISIRYNKEDGKTGLSYDTFYDNGFPKDTYHFEERNGGGTYSLVESVDDKIESATNYTDAVAKSKQDALPYATNAIPAMVIANAPWLTEHQSLTPATNYTDAATNALAAIIPGAYVPSAEDEAFSNAVLAVGLNIDTNSVAVLNEIAATFGDFPVEGTATTIGGLLMALAAAVAWLKRKTADIETSVGTANADIETALNGEVN